jgi:hypothetical protein
VAGYRILSTKENGGTTGRKYAQNKLKTIAKQQ